MKNSLIAIAALLLLSANAMAAIKIDGRQTRNMDDVLSLGVVYINHNTATVAEAEKVIDQDNPGFNDAIAMKEPDSNGNIYLGANTDR